MPSEVGRALELSVSEPILVLLMYPEGGYGEVIAFGFKCSTLLPPAVRVIGVGISLVHAAHLLEIKTQGCPYTRSSGAY